MLASIRGEITLQLVVRVACLTTCLLVLAGLALPTAPTTDDEVAPTVVESPATIRQRGEGPPGRARSDSTRHATPTSSETEPATTPTTTTTTAASTTVADSEPATPESPPATDDRSPSTDASSVTEPAVGTDGSALPGLAAPDATPPTQLEFELQVDNQLATEHVITVFGVPEADHGAATLDRARTKNPNADRYPANQEFDASFLVPPDERILLQFDRKLCAVPVNRIQVRIRISTQADGTTVFHVQDPTAPESFSSPPVAPEIDTTRFSCVPENGAADIESDARTRRTSSNSTEPR